jgi:spermidine synthase
MLVGDPAKPRRIGILGLGCGTLAAYGRSGDEIRIYEINPQVRELADAEFTFIRDSPARVSTVLGDGRLALEREPDQQFDVLVMDAFSGDSVPVHLLTLEAFSTYERHLRPGGILAVNISNRYLDFHKILERAASNAGKLAMLFEFHPQPDDHACFDATWVLIVDRRVREENREQFRTARELKPNIRFRPFTDDFSNLFSVFR